MSLPIGGVTTHGTLRLSAHMCRDFCAARMSILGLESDLVHVPVIVTCGLARDFVDLGSTILNRPVQTGEL